MHQFFFLNLFESKQTTFVESLLRLWGKCCFERCYCKAVTDVALIAVASRAFDTVVVDVVAVDDVSAVVDNVNLDPGSKMG